MNKIKITPVKQHKSSILNELLEEISPLEQAKERAKMTLAAAIDEALTAQGWSKSEFAKKLGKHPSEMTKWLSGTHNFTHETLVEIAFALNMSVGDLFSSRGVQIANKLSIVVKGHSQGLSSIKYQTPIDNDEPNSWEWAHIGYVAAPTLSCLPSYTNRLLEK